jgi:hypothetical protein
MRGWGVVLTWNAQGLGFSAHIYRSSPSPPPPPLGLEPFHQPFFVKGFFKIESHEPFFGGWL